MLYHLFVAGLLAFCIHHMLTYDPVCVTDSFTGESSCVKIPVDCN